jgi:hypothetical protein
VIDTDGEDVPINTALGRFKTNNMTRDSRVVVGVYDPPSPYERVLYIRGRVASITAEGADAHIDALARKFLGVDTYRDKSPSKTRVIVRIEVDQASGNR